MTNTNTTAGANAMAQGQTGNSGAADGAGGAATTALQRLFGETAERIFAENVTKSLLERFDAGEAPAGLWQLVTEAGFPLVAVPESAGGVGGGWADAYPILRALGFWQAPLPLAETIVAAALAARAGLEAPDGPLTLVEQGRGAALALRADAGQVIVEGDAQAVPWARQAGHVLVSGRDEGGRALLALVPLAGSASVELSHGANLAREPRDAVRFRGARSIACAALPEGLPREPVWLLGAMARCATLVGALESVLDQSVRYANDRGQFGKPIAKYQAIQQQLALMAGDVGAARMAARIAMVDAPARFDVAVAKVRAGEAATRATGIAHQVHGAIGFTYEHTLHFATRRLWSWRGEFGSDADWAQALGEAAIAGGGEAFWAALTARTWLRD
jgi:acyl-CoA dehydrogenase